MSLARMVLSSLWISRYLKSLATMVLSMRSRLRLACVATSAKELKRVEAYCNESQMESAVEASSDEAEVAADSAIQAM